MAAAQDPDDGVFHFDWDDVLNPQPRAEVYNNADLCKLLLSAIHPSSRYLQIKKSHIKNAGAGLFTKHAIAADQEIFRSNPLVSCRHPTVRDVCDLCLKVTQDKDSKLLNLNKVVRVLPCSGCKVARYCSKACQRKAWQLSHKFECGLLKENPGMPAIVIALHRLLSTRKRGVFNDSQWNAMLKLESRFDDYTEGSLAEDILAIAMEAGKKMDCQVPFNDIWKLTCILFTNGMNIRPAERDVSFGAGLDLAVSMMNHDCDPNAFVFFEANEVRVRSLKEIPAGAEITVSYSDPRIDVLTRQEVIRVTQFFDCNCSYCVRQLRDHNERNKSSPERLQSILVAQKNMMQATKNVIEGCYGMFKTKPDDLLNQFKAEVDEFECKGYGKSQAWPDHIEPLPSVRMNMAGMYKKTYNYILALQYALRGCLLSERRAGPAWVNDVFELSRILIQVSNEPQDAVPYTLVGFPEYGQMKNVCRGFVVALLVAAIGTFGTDTGYVVDLIAWGWQFFETEGEPPIAHPAFAGRFAEAQEKLLEWANMSVPSTERLKLPKEDDVAGLLIKLEELNARLNAADAAAET